MSRHMEPGIEFGDWDLIDGPNGEEWVPGGSQPSDVEVLESVKDKYGANFSASGYTDQTEYSIFDTCEEAVEFLVEEMLAEEEIEEVIDEDGRVVPNYSSDTEAGGVIVRSGRSPTAFLVLKRVPDGSPLAVDAAITGAHWYAKKNNLVWDRADVETDELPSYEWCERAKRNTRGARRNGSASDRAEFRGFCRQATDRQLYGIYEKESAYPEDEDRAEYTAICLSAMGERGLELPSGAYALRNARGVLGHPARAAIEGEDDFAFYNISDATHVSQEGPFVATTVEPTRDEARVRQISEHAARKGYRIEWNSPRDTGTTDRSHGRQVLKYPLHPIGKLERQDILGHAGRRPAQSNRKWSSHYKHTLPASSFLYHHGDVKKLPFRDAEGNVSCSHLRNALSRLSHAAIPAREKSAIRRRAEELLAEHCGR